MDQLLEYLASDRSWRVVARPGFSADLLRARLNAWRRRGAIAELVLHLHENLLGRGEVSLDLFSAAREQGKDLFAGGWRSNTANLLLAPRMLKLPQVELPGLHLKLMKVWLPDRRS